VKRSWGSILFVATLTAALGAVAGFLVAQHTFRDRETDLRDLARIRSAVDLSTRLTALRDLRKGHLPTEDIESWEISAIVLLDSIALDEVTASSQSYCVFHRVSKNLATYMRDFPKSQFSDPRHTSVVSKLMPWANASGC